MTPSAQALHEFNASHSEQAFQTLVERHLNLVFNTARRIGGGDSHFAEDVAQVVFRDLARKAHRIPSGTPLEGWLYRHTSFTALKMLRTERRRELREEQAMHLHEEPSSSDAREQVEAALSRLGEQDREAVVLRYIEAWDWRAIAATLGISEDAAQKRASRALDKLRSILKTDGSELSASAAIALLATLAASAPPSLPTFRAPLSPRPQSPL